MTELSTEHHHHHHHSHNHKHHNHHSEFSEIKNRQVLMVAMIITALFTLVEFIGGLISNSLALLSDSGHMLGDSTALTLAYFAIFFASKKANLQKTFGYRRLETIAAFVNGLMLVFISLLILKEGIGRIITPVPVNSAQLLGIASIGLLVNILVAGILFSQSSHSMNIRGAFMHVLSDILGSFGAIISGLLIIYFGWNWADPVISIFIAGLILFSAYGLLQESFNLLMEGVPGHIKLKKIETLVLENPDVIGIHDLHVWSLNEHQIILTGHIIIEHLNISETVINNLSNQLKNKFNISHCTFQVETQKCDLFCH